MNCINHSNQKAVGQCEKCFTWLCDNCMVHTEDDHMVCNECVTILFFEDVKAYTKKRKLRREARGTDLSKRWRPTYLQVIVTIGIVLTLFFFGLRAYWNETIWYSEIVLDGSNQMKLFTKLQYSLERYAIAHEDRYPDDLYDLLPHYLSATDQNRNILSKLHYEKNQDEGFLVSIIEDSYFRGDKLIATSEDIRLAESEKK